MSRNAQGVAVKHTEAAVERMPEDETTVTENGVVERWTLRVALVSAYGDRLHAARLGVVALEGLAISPMK